MARRIFKSGPQQSHGTVVTRGQPDQEGQAGVIECVEVGEVEDHVSLDICSHQRHEHLATRGDGGLIERATQFHTVVAVLPQ